MTRRMHELYSFIADFKRDHGWSPSFEEMKAGVGLRSKAGVFRLVDELEEAGLVKRHPGRARSVEIIRPRQVSVAAAAAWLERHAPEARELLSDEQIGELLAAARA